MTPLQTFLAGVKKRLENATPGPWHISARKGSGYEGSIRTSVPFSREIAFMQSNVGTTGGSQSDPDAQLIASAPTDLTTAIQIIEIQAKCLEECETDTYSGSVTEDLIRHCQADVDRLLEKK